jgi:hypothetical protein
MFQPKLAPRLFCSSDTLYLVFRDRFSKAFQFFYNTAKSSRSQAEQESHRSYTALGRVHRQNGRASSEVWLFFAAKLAYNGVAEGTRGL